MKRVALAALAAVALVACSEDAGVTVTTDAPAGSVDDVTTTTDSTDSTEPTELADSQPATITGESLPEYDREADPDPAVGTPAPAVEGFNFQGDAVTIDGATDGPTMVVFLAHWCPHCNAEIPVLLDWKASGDFPEGLQVVGVATAVSPTSVNYPPAQWFEDKGWSWPVIVDESQGDGYAGTVATAFGASGWPFIVFIDGDGNVTARAAGETSVEDLQAMAETATG